MRFQLIVVVVIAGVAARTLPAAPQTATGSSGFTIQADLNAPSLTVWMAYLLARLAYVVKHPAEYPSGGHGQLVATFSEELAGRAAAVEVYQQMRSQGKNDRDAYWEDVVKVSKAGFLPEYVWTYFRKPSWKESVAPKKLAPFTSWQRSNLASHRPATYGGITYGK
jgi:hypothetical protein